MITAQIVNDELTWQGEITAGDIYPGYCCPGHNWEVVLTSPDASLGYVSIWGKCHNPNCPDGDATGDDPYRGVSNILLEDFAGDLADGKVRHAPAWDDPAKTADFFTGPAAPDGPDPYAAFGDWAKVHGYDLDDEAQRAAAVAEYGEG